MKFIIIPKEDPVYDSPSSEFESVLSSKEWVSDVNNERL